MHDDFWHQEFLWAMHFSVFITICNKFWKVRAPLAICIVVAWTGWILCSPDNWFHCQCAHQHAVHHTIHWLIISLGTDPLQPVSSAVQKTSYGIISWPTTTEWCWSWPVDEDYTHGNAERPSSRLGNNMCVRWYASLMSCLKWHHSWYHLGCRCSYCISFPGWDGE